MKITIPRLLVALGALMLLSACDDGPPTGQPSGNQQPSRPQLVVPLRGVAIPGESTWLEWRCHDPENDSLRYDLYIGDGRYPEFMSDLGSITRIFVNPQVSDSFVQFGVVAVDPQGRSVPSDVWRIPVGDAFRYPLNLGDEWTFSGKSWFTNIRGSEWNPPDTQRFSSVVRNASSKAGGVVYSKLQETSEYIGFGGETQSFQGAVYMMNRPDGLFYFGLDGQTATTPGKSSSEVALYLGGYAFSGISELHSVLTGKTRMADRLVTAPARTFFDSPRLALYYPPEVGIQWSYIRRGDSDGDVFIDKVITDSVQITVPAGTFDCYEIRWLYDLDRDHVWDDNLELYDYVSKEGLIKRVMFSRNIRVGSYEEAFIAIADNNSVWELTSFTPGGASE